MYRNAHFSENYLLLRKNVTLHDANLSVSSPCTAKYRIKFTAKLNVSHWKKTMFLICFR